MGASLVATLALAGVILSAQASAVATAEPAISIGDAQAYEGGPEGSDTAVALSVTLSAASAAVVTVDWTTAAGTADAEDFHAGSGTVTFAPGDTEETVTVVIDGGSSPEAAEFFTVELSSPVNATIARGSGQVLILNDDAPPPPETGEVNVTPTGGGGQCVALKDGAGCKPLEFGQQIDIAEIAYINPKLGKVEIRSIVGIGQFYGGRFSVQELGGAAARSTAGAAAKPILVVKLSGGNFRACKTNRSLAAAGAAEAKKKPIRRLWGKGKGRFRTRGQYSSGTVRGTNWVTEDYCNGTRTRVVSGVVQVYDLVKKKWVLLKAGGSYFAQAGKTG